MSVHGDVAVWAVALLRERTAAFETIRKQAAGHWKGGKRLHKVRTGARRLRAWVEDLQECLADPAALIEPCKAIGDGSTPARDAQVMMQRLQRYRRFAMPAERGEIDALCTLLRKRHETAMKDAKRAVKACRPVVRP